jgi:hypothetical protein
VTARDRTVLMVLGVIAVLAAFWFALLAPERKDAKDLDAKLTTAQQRLDTANQTAAAAEQSRRTYASDYATVARLGKAVPVDDDVPALIYQLQHASDAAHVDFRSIQLSAGGGSSAAAATTPSTPAGEVAAAAKEQNDGSPSSSSASQPASGATATQTAAATLPPGASVGPAGFPTMPFDFRFNGGFFHLEDFLRKVDAFTKVAGDRVRVRGRLLTVDGISLGAGPKGFPQMTANIHATAYLLPADEGLTAGATSAGPAATPSTTPATGSTPGASPTPTATLTGVGK